MGVTRNEHRTIQIERHDTAGDYWKRGGKWSKTFDHVAILYEDGKLTQI